MCKKIASALKNKGNRFDGFYTEEVRDRNGSRIGFDIVGVKNLGRSSLARLKYVFARNNNNKSVTEYILYLTFLHGQKLNRGSKGFKVSSGKLLRFLG